MGPENHLKWMRGNTNLLQNEVLCFSYKINIETDLEEIIRIWNLCDLDFHGRGSEDASEGSANEDNHRNVHRNDSEKEMKRVNIMYKGVL